MKRKPSRLTLSRWGLLASSVALVTACTIPSRKAQPLPAWSFDESMIFPSDSSLSRPEDGIALADGRLIVTDQAHGLRVVTPDGKSAPFGALAAAGYVHLPPQHAGGANGISLEPDGKHLLLTDAFHGDIYRVDIATGAANVVYHHPYGVNAAVRDSRGAIWLTQSTRNAGEARLWAAVDVPVPDGALLRLAWKNGKPANSAVVVVDSLNFANGLAIDERAGRLYLAETNANRVLGFDVNFNNGSVSDRTVAADFGADNVKVDNEGRLWAVSPITSEVVVIDPSTGERSTVFRQQSPAQRATAEEFMRRGETGAHRMSLVTPDFWAPLPGLITGVIIAPGGGPVYLTGLGNALVRLVR